MAALNGSMARGLRGFRQQAQAYSLFDSTVKEGNEDVRVSGTFWMALYGAGSKDVNPSSDPLHSAAYARRGMTDYCGDDRISSMQGHLATSAPSPPSAMIDAVRRI